MEPPDWAVAASGTSCRRARARDAAELYGGDLYGIEEHLDHIERLGANVLYLTPIFPAGSTHRYDATTFDRVDPLLGGDEALASLVARRARRGHARRRRPDHEPHRRRARVVPRRAADPTAPERGFYYFDDALPNGYESWLGVPSLPKLDWARPSCGGAWADRRAAGSTPPYELDGWRIDVANMTGRYREVDVNAEVARESRARSGRATPARRRARPRLPRRPRAAAAGTAR